MKPVKVYDAMLPAVVMSKLVAGEELTIKKSGKIFTVDGVPVEIRPRLARPVNWREMKKVKK